MDRTGADFDRVLTMIRDRLGMSPLPIQEPLGSESDFRGVLDLVNERMVVFEAQEDGSTYKSVPVPEEERERLVEARHRLIDEVSHFSDEVLELYVSEEPIPADTLRRAIREATLNLNATPVACGAALRNMGVQLLLDAVVDYLPAPEEMPSVHCTDPRDGQPVERERTDDAPASALAFKTVADVSGDLTFLRVYSGKLEKGTALLNSRSRKKVRIGRLLKIHAKSRESIEVATAGDIVAVMGLSDVFTGDTLSSTDEPVVLGSMEFPEAVISMSIAPKKRSDRDRLADALSRLTREDPTFRSYTDPETQELIVAGMGELHLEVVRSRIEGEYSCPTVAGAPRVAYRQALRKPVDVEARHVKQTGGHGQFAVAKVRFEEGDGDREVEFESEITGGSVPREYWDSVAAGITDAAERGGELRFPFVNVRAVLYDGKHHEVDSSDMAFREAGRLAFTQAMERAGTVLLEPRFQFLVEVPQEYLGDVLSDLQSRRAEVQSLKADQPVKEIRGTVPVSELFSYSTTLRSLTQGRGTFHTETSRYTPVPVPLAREVTRETLARREARGKGAA
jgi:elongation factor G